MHLLNIFHKTSRAVKFYKDYQTKQKENDILIASFNDDFEKYNSIANQNQKAKKEYLYPCLFDKTNNTDIEPTYFYQDSWAFERILKRRPQNHVDIGSHNKFVAFLSKITNLTMVDLRPLSLKMDSINFIKGDILNLPFESESIESLSSLCVIEHIGLGRYGDNLDPCGSEKAIKEITRVMKKEGRIFISVPVSDKNIVAFNAGRIFEIESLLNLLDTQYTICDKKFIVGNSLQETFEPNDRFGCTVLLELKKK